MSAFEAIVKTAANMDTNTAERGARRILQLWAMRRKLAKRAAGFAHDMSPRGSRFFSSGFGGHIEGIEATGCSCEVAAAVSSSAGLAATSIFPSESASDVGLSHILMGDPWGEEDLAGSTASSREAPERQFKPADFSSTTTPAGALPPSKRLAAAASSTATLSAAAAQPVPPSLDEELKGSISSTPDWANECSSLER